MMKRAFYLHVHVPWCHLQASGTVSASGTSSVLVEDLKITRNLLDDLTVPRTLCSRLQNLESRCPSLDRRAGVYLLSRVDRDSTMGVGGPNKV